MDELTRPAVLTPETLSVWLPALHKAGQQYRFYKTPEWKHLRAWKLQAEHYECEDCRAQTPSRITRATTVHHDRYVDKYPALALSKTWTDSKGREHQQLYALCEDCHNKRHGRFGHTPQKNEPITPERW